MAYGISTLTGTATGAASGSVFGPVGTGIGAGVGFLGGLYDDITHDYSGGASQRNTQRPNQIALQDSLIDRIQQRLNGQGGLSAMSQNAINRFNSQTVPSLAERFTSLGSGGSQGSSAFSQAIGNAGADLNSNLQEMDFNQILQLLGHALGQSSENIQYQDAPGFGENSAKGLAQLLPLLQQIKGNGGGNSGTASSGTGILGNAGDITKNLHRQNYGTLNPFANRLGGSSF